MIAALLLGVCLQMPVFGETDFMPHCPPDATPSEPCWTECLPADEATECDCSEWFEWDTPLGGGPVEWYEINRETVSSGDRLWVGSVEQQCDDTPTCELARVWHVAKDSAMPHEGVLYRYRVRACNWNDTLGEAQCGPWSLDDDTVEYRGAPYACYEGGREVQCYVGDPILH